jgi:hypothetical protein
MLLVVYKNTLHMRLRKPKNSQLDVVCMGLEFKCVPFAFMLEQAPPTCNHGQDVVRDRML